MNRNKLHHPIGDFVCFCSEARAPRSIYQEVPVEIIVKLLGSFPNFFGKFLGAIRLAFFSHQALSLQGAACISALATVFRPHYFYHQAVFSLFLTSDAKLRIKMWCTRPVHPSWDRSPISSMRIYANCQTMGTPQIWQPYQWRPFCSCLGFLQRFRVHKSFDHLHFCTWTLGRL